MMQRSLALFCPALLLLLLAVQGAAAGSSQQEHIANFKNVAGEVTVLRHGASLPAETGMQLYATDTVTTGKSGSAGLLFLDGTAVAIGPASRVDIADYRFSPQAKQYDFSLYLQRGQVLFSTGRIGKLAPEAVKLRTPTAVIGVRGTRFIVKVD